MARALRLTAALLIFGLPSMANADVFHLYSSGENIVVGSAFELTSDNSPGYGGMYLDITTPFPISGLSILSADYKMTIGTFGGGSPRFTLFDPTETGAVYIYFGTPIGGGSFSDPTPGVWASTGNYASLASLDVRVYDNNFGGDGHSSNVGETWAAFVARTGGTSVKYITVDLDGGWLATQQMLVNNFRVNNENFAAAVPETSTWVMMLVGFAGIGFAAYRRTRKQTASLVAA